jgi:hypothetical protein
MDPSLLSEALGGYKNHELGASWQGNHEFASSWDIAQPYNPAGYGGYYYSYALGMSDAGAVGYEEGWFGGDTALFWTAHGTQVVLGAGGYGSQATGISGNQIVGTYNNSATIWSAIDYSRVSLNPAGAIASDAYATDGTTQVGLAQFADGQAGLWHGTASSWVSLDPGNVISSTAYAVSGHTEAGFVETNSGYYHAYLWHDSASSWVDLNPTSAYTSEALGVYGNTAVGFAAMKNANGANHAAVWEGSAGQFLDINPAGFTESRATAIWTYNGVEYISGYGDELGPGHGEIVALLWERPLVTPEPAPFFALGGLLLVGRFRRSNRRLQIRG